MADDEDDYMSDKFLVGMEKNDVRPGLIYNRSDKRFHENLKERHKIEEEKKLRKTAQAKLPQQKLIEGLEQPIDSSNKGFALLQKMGFNPGTGLGKSGEGRKDPLPIELKSDRYGLGRKTAMKEVAAMKLELIRTKHKETEKCTEDYLSRMRGKAAEKTMECDLMKSQRVCFELDRKHEIIEPVEPWFWPLRSREKKAKKSLKKENLEEEDCDGERNISKDETDSEDEEEDSEESEECDILFTTSEKLQILTLYIRKTYFYCIWCGTEFEDLEDIQKECPGSTRDDH